MSERKKLGIVIGAVLLVSTCIVLTAIPVKAFQFNVDQIIYGPGSDVSSGSSNPANYVSIMTWRTNINGENQLLHVDGSQSSAFYTANGPGYPAEWYMYNFGAIGDNGVQPTTTPTQGDELKTFVESVWGKHGWNGPYNYTAASNHTLTSADISDSSAYMPDVELERIPTPQLNYATSSEINITWTGMQFWCQPNFDNSGNSFSGKWHADCVENYTVYRSTDNKTFTFIGWSTPHSPGGTIYYSDTDVTPGTTYYYKIGVEFTPAGNTRINTTGLSEGSAGIT